MLSQSSIYHTIPRLFGITTVQTSIYFQQTSKDKVTLKAIVSEARLRRCGSTDSKTDHAPVVCTTARNVFCMSSLTIARRLVDAAEQALFTTVVYHYAVQNFDNPIALVINIPYVIRY